MRFRDEPTGYNLNPERSRTVWRDEPTGPPTCIGRYDCDLRGRWSWWDWAGKMMRADTAEEAREGVIQAWLIKQGLGPPS